jgi:hypothetical protein
MLYELFDTIKELGLEGPIFRLDGDYIAEIKEIYLTEGRDCKFEYGEKHRVDRNRFAAINGCYMFCDKCEGRIVHVSQSAIKELRMFDDVIYQFDGKCSHGCEAIRTVGVNKEK